MALLVPAARSQSFRSNYSGRPTTSWGTTLTASSTPHALPASPTEVVTSTAVESEWVRFTFHGMAVAATITDALCNIYIGGAGTETLLIDSLQVGWSSTVALGSVPRVYWFPLRIPRATRISASLRSLIASDVAYVMVEYGVSNGNHWCGSGVETLGEVTGSSRGTSMTLGTASDGGWTSMGTTGRRYRYLTPAMMSNNDTSIVAGWTAVDVSGDNSTVLQGMENLVSIDNASELQANVRETGFWCDVPSGTTLYLRGQSHTTPSGVQYGTIYGVY